MASDFTVPAKVETEKTVLGYILSSPRGIEEWTKARDLTGGRPEHLFFASEYVMFAKTISELIDRHPNRVGGRIMEAPLVDLLVRRDGGDPVDYQKKVAVLISSNTLGRDDFMAALEVLSKAASLRDQIAVMEKQINSIVNDEPEPSEVADTLRMGMDQTSSVFHDERTSFGNILDRLDEQDESGNHGYRMPTGIKELDELMLGGIEPGRLVVLAGRPGMGKTTMMVNLALSALADDYAVFFVSLEVGPRELRDKMVSALSYVPRTEVSRWYDSGREEAESSEHLEAMDRAHEELHDSRLHALFSNDMTNGIQSLVTLVRSWRAEDKAAQIRNGEEYVPSKVVVFLDYLQLMASGPEQPRLLSEYAQTLKRESLDQEVAFIVGSQLNRAAAGGSSSLANLKGSGGLEEHSDAVIVITRPYAIEMDQAGSSSSSEMDMVVDVAKNRIYRTASFHVAWLPDIQTVASLSDIGGAAAIRYDEEKEKKELRRRVSESGDDVKPQEQSRRRRRRSESVSEDDL